MNTQQTMRSSHPGGVVTCFVDGSVHFISNDIDTNPREPFQPGLHQAACCSVWDRINLSADKLALDDADF